MCDCTIKKCPYHATFEDKCGLANAQSEAIWLGEKTCELAPKPQEKKEKSEDFYFYILVGLWISAYLIMKIISYYGKA